MLEHIGQYLWVGQPAQQGRGRRSIRRRVGGQCAAPHRRAGSLIPHASPIRALVVPVIEAAFGAAPMTTAGGTDRSGSGRRATGRRTIRHGRGHRPRRSQTGRGSGGRFSGEAGCPRRWRGGALRLDTALSPVAQERTTGSVRRRIEAVPEGLEGSAPGPPLVPLQPDSVTGVAEIRRGARRQPQAERSSCSSPPPNASQPFCAHRSRAWSRFDQRSDFRTFR
jgi:hypothetical protein